MPDVLGYARVSTSDQDLEAQRRRLRDEAGAMRVFDDVISGKSFNRPGLNEMLSFCRAGDIICVVRLDRLGRSLKELVSFQSRLQQSVKVPFSDLTIAEPNPLCGLVQERERTINSGFGVNGSGIEQRHRAVRWLHQQHDLRTTQNDGFSALFDQMRDHHAIGLARCRFRSTLNQLVVDDAMNSGAIIGIGGQHIEAESMLQSALVELLFHRECGTQ